MTSSIRVIFDNFGYVQILKMSKVRLYNQARGSNEGEEASKSIITAFNFLLASKMICLSNIYGWQIVLGFWSRIFRIFHLTFVWFQPYQCPTSSPVRGPHRPGWPDLQLPFRNFLSYDVQTFRLVVLSLRHVLTKGMLHQGLKVKTTQ